MVRDYTFVGDVVAANKLAVSKGSLDYFNIGTGQETKTLKLYETVFQVFQEVVGESPKDLSVPVRALARPGDLTKSCLVAEKAKTTLNWKAATELKEGILKTWEWRIQERS
ncbi:MAG: GDP-mannose 4,6-dehydratase [Deltaproteobacteria bacterium]